MHRAAADGAILAVLVLILTPHTAVVRAQILDLASALGNLTGGADLSGAKAAADQFKLNLASAVSNANDSLSNAKAAADQFKAKVGSIQDAADNAAAEVPDIPKTGVNETQIAEFLAGLKENFGSGANLQALIDISQSSSLTEAQMSAETAYNTLVGAAQLGISAITAGPFAVISILVAVLAFAAAVTSTIAGAFYASASAVGLYASIAAAIVNQCSTPGDVTLTDGGDEVIMDDGGGGSSSSSGGGDGDSSSGGGDSSSGGGDSSSNDGSDGSSSSSSSSSSGGGSSSSGRGDGNGGDDPNGRTGPTRTIRSPTPRRVSPPPPPPPAKQTKNTAFINCFDAQQQAGWMSKIQQNANDMSKYIVPYVFSGASTGMDGALALTESLLNNALKLARQFQKTA